MASRKKVDKRLEDFEPFPVFRRALLVRIALHSGGLSKNPPHLSFITSPLSPPRERGWG
jgi:hypothetical protein